MKKWDGPSRSWPTPHTTPFFLPPEDPSQVLLRHNYNSTPLCEPDPALDRRPWQQQTGTWHGRSEGPRQTQTCRDTPATARLPQYTLAPVCSPAANPAGSVLTPASAQYTLAPVCCCPPVHRRCFGVLREKVSCYDKSWPEFDECRVTIEIKKSLLICLLRERERICLL